MLLRYLQDLTLQMQIIYILCVHTTSLVWKKEKKNSNMCSGGDENQETL